MAGNYSPPILRTAPEATRLQLSGPDETGAVVPFDLTDYTLKLQIRLYAGAAGDPLLTLSTVDGTITIEDIENGIVELDWWQVRADIAAMPAAAEIGSLDQPSSAQFAYDLLAISNLDGRPQRVLFGIVPILDGVTQL